MKNRRMKLISCALAVCLACGAAGVSIAYMTDAHEKTNVITVGNVDIDLTEPTWNPDDGKNVLPRETVSKNPQITNNGSLACWAYMRVTSPIKNIQTVDNGTKRKKPAAPTELFSWNVNDGWELISQETAADGSAVHYVYAYKTLLESGKTTQSLFDNVTMTNYLEGQIDKNEGLNIPVQAVAIQQYVDESENGTPDLKQIYKQYLSQETYNKKEAEDNNVE